MIKSHTLSLLSFTHFKVSHYAIEKRHTSKSRKETVQHELRVVIKFVPCKKLDTTYTPMDDDAQSSYIHIY